MTTIDKLLIQGIRSFSPQNRNIIEFYQPLTLIVGPNGAGKTTIIECLKYATTGNMPPGTKKGNAFVHDPKVAGEREVKAQIKLRFRNVNGKPIVCTRSLQLTQRAANPVLKTLDSALETFNDQGMRVSQSFRCVDMDREIPELIGVSRPILENVIFCHQEDSNWPLSEGSSLKKKFDDIFAATRYTKALEAIKKHRKEHAQQIRELKLKLESLQTQKDTAHQVRRELESKKGFMTSADEQIEALQQQIKEAEQTANELKRQSSLITSLIAEIEKLEAVKLQMQMEKTKTLGELKKEFSETDEELLEMAARFHKDMEEKTANARDMESRLASLNKNKQKAESMLNGLREQSSRLNGAIERQQALVAERDRDITQFAAQYQLPGYESLPLSPSQVTEFFGLTKTLLAGLRQKVDELKAQHSQSDKAMLADIEKAQSQTSSYAAQIKQKTQLLEANKRKIQQLAAQLSEKRAQQGQLSSIEAKYEKEEQQLGAMKQDLNLEGATATLKQLDEEIRAMEREVNALNSTMRALSTEAATRAGLNLKKAEAKKKEDAYKASFEAKQEEINGFIGGGATPENIREKLTAVLSKKRTEVTVARNKLQEAKMSASNLIGEQRTVQGQLQQQESKLAAKQKDLSQLGLEGRTLPALIEETETKIEELRSNVLMTESAERIYETFISNAQANKECPLCERDIHGAALQDFLKKMQEILNKVPDALRDERAALQESEALHQQLIDLKPSWQAVEQLQKEEIPALSSRLLIVDERHEEINEQIVKLTEELSRVQKEEQQLMALKGDADNIARLYSEFTALGKEIAAEERRLSLSSSGGKSLEDVEKELQEKQKKGTELRKQRDTLTSESQQKRERLHRQESQLHRLKEQLLETKGASSAVLSLQSQHNELELATPALTKEIEDAQSKMEQARANKAALSKQRDEALREFDTNSDVLQKEREAFQQRLAQLENIEKQLGGKSVETVEAELEAVNTRKADVEQKLGAMVAKIEEANETLLQIREMVSTSDVSKRNIDDNVKYRKQMAAIAKVDKDITSKEQQASKYNPEDLDFELDKTSKLVDEKKKKVNQIIGKRDTFAKQIREHAAELKKPLYKDVDDKFRQMLIQVKTEEMANSDLEKYYQALDKALMKYHTVKMMEINKIIKELWQRTYKGNDIDTIEIRSDAETGAKPGARSTYNYRVVMVKGDTELDMRGRCSAGQKVLASLIIRLALGETFCLNCGILALDEPTTNLDRLNVESFANALVSIIASRRQQRNFQLIVITHDEEFVQLLGRSEHSDFYWRVSKDATGHSILERKDIRDLS